jgi:RHS repeat-associated protein
MYDNLNHMISAQEVKGGVTTLVAFTYDVFGNRIEKDVTVNGTTTVTRFAYDGPEVWADLNGSNSLIMRYIHGDTVDQLFARIVPGSQTTVTWYLTDRLGSVRALMNQAGNLIDTIAYDRFGTATESQPANGDRYKFTGREFDSETNLQYNRARYYDPKVGRWDGQDPLGFDAGDVNLYRYAGNNAGNITDPSGLEEKIEVKPAELITSGKISDLDAAYTNQPFRDTAGNAYDNIKKRFGKRFKEWEMGLPDKLSQAGLFKLKNKDINEKGFKLEAGSITAAFYLFFIRFDVCNPTPENLGIRVSETKETVIDGGEPIKAEQKLPVEETNGRFGYKKAPKEKDRFQWSYVYGDAPGFFVITKPVKKGQANNEKEWIPYTETVTFDQTVELVAMSTLKPVASKSFKFKLTIDKTGKVDASFPK